MLDCDVLADVVGVVRFRRERAPDAYRLPGNVADEVVHRVYKSVVHDSQCILA